MIIGQDQVKNERLEKTWVKQGIELEGCKYVAEYCIETDEIILTQPAKTIVGYRNTISDHYPELCGYERIGIVPTIAQMIYDAVGMEPVEGDGSDMRMPIMFTDVRTVVIGRTEFIIGYDAATDLLMVQVPVKINRMPSWLLKSELWEVTTLHEGRLLAEIKAFIALHRVDELDFNPMDVF